MRTGTPIRILLALLVLVTVGASGAGGGRPSGTEALFHVNPRPFDPRQQTDLAFGERSHWLQPWRAYQQTVPARTLEDAIGINFNVAPAQADRVAGLLAAAGVHRVRYEIGWCSVDYADPGRFTDPAAIDTVLRAFARHRLRPLLLLNANHGCPGPLRRFRVHVTAGAVAGARELHLDEASAQLVQPLLTGLDSTTQYKAAATLFTHVEGTVVTLSKPLAHDLAPGFYPGTTLRYAPFERAGTRAFDTTLDGWLAYVGLVTRTARSVLGSDAFDVEVWNELTFGSDFLDANTYYAPPLAGVDVEATRDAILARTVEQIRRPDSGVSGIGIGDGFTNEEPWDSGATLPAGVTALDKHPYAGPRRFPEQAVFDTTRPLDALGRPDGTQDADGAWHDAFVPSYTAFFPEYYLTGIQTENLVRDLSPITTGVLGVPHGRYTRAPGGAPPAMWLTEAGLDPTLVPAPVLARFKAKETLRYLVSWVNRGARAVYLFAAGDARGPWGLVDPSRRDGGAALGAIRRLTAALAGPASTPVVRKPSVTLQAIAQRGAAAQFEGDGTAAHPALYDRDVLGFFPFRISRSKVAVAVYVMSRNLLRVYRSDLPRGDPRRFDHPPEDVRLTIAGVGRFGKHVGATDPLTGRDVPVRVLARMGDRIVVELRVTDSPRLLLLGGS